MKTCANCQVQQPDNFISCAHCGASLSQQPAQGIPMQMFMYDREAGKRNGDMDTKTILIACAVTAIGISSLFTVGIVVAAVFFKEFSFWIEIAILATLMALIIAVALIIRSKRPKSYIAYIFYDSILYKITMQTRAIILPSGNSVRRRMAALEHTANAMRELDEKTKYAEEFLKLFARYTAGEKLWDKMTGSPDYTYIEPLNQLRITKETAKYYIYSYVDQEGKVCSGKILKATYPGIGTIFNYCH